MRKSHPVVFCLTAKVIPEVGSFSVAVSVHWEGEYAPFTLTGIVDLYAVTVVGAARAVPIEIAEASASSTRRMETVTMLTLDFVLDLAIKFRLVYCA